MEPTNKIKALLEKYWLAETTDEEEAELKAYFDSIHSADDELAPLFHYFRQQQTVGPDQSFDERLQSITNTQPSTSIWRRPLWNAAAVLLIIISTFLIIQLKKTGTAVHVASADTYQNPTNALQQAKNSLLLISKKLNKAEQYTLELKQLGKQHESIQPKSEP